MKVKTSIALQAVLVGVALAITLLRCWVRLRLERRKPTPPDFFALGAWFFTLGWFVCSVIVLHIQTKHPLVQLEGQREISESVSYLVTVFIGCYMFDIGLYFPKASILSFYLWLIPLSFRRLRVAVFISIAFTTCAFLSALLLDTFITRPIANNWSLENQEMSVWNSGTAFIANWALNWATDLMVFVLPFFVISRLQLRKRQKIGLWGIFSLGLINMTLSLARCIVFVSSTSNVDDASVNLWFTAELATSTIVISLPALKPLLMKSTPNNSGNSAESGSNPVRTFGQKETTRTFVETGKLGDDEIELVMQDSRKSSLSPTRTMSVAGMHDGKDVVYVTSEITVFCEVA